MKRKNAIFNPHLQRFQVITTSNVGRLKIKRKIMKKKRKDDSNVQIVTSTTTSSSAVYGELNNIDNDQRTTRGHCHRLLLL